MRPVNGVVLILHGLNLDPAAMGELASVLEARGFKTVRVTFAGHSGDFDLFRRVTREAWLGDVARGFEQVERLSFAHAGAPIHVIGFSMGGLFALDWLQDQRHAREKVKTLTLLAPPLRLSWYARLLRISPWFPGHWVVPSFAEFEMRANDGTSMAAYRSVWDSYRKVVAAGFTRFDQIPVLVMAHPKDELVHARELKQLAEKHANWTYAEATLDETIELRKRYFHFISHPKAAGRRSFASLCETVLAHCGG